MIRRFLGRSGIEVSALGLGCWAIGGPALSGGQPIGWGEVNDAESIRAIHAAIELGVNFLDTANSYGAGHSERVIAQAIKGRRDQVIIATKFGNVVDEKAGQMTGQSAEPDDIRAECEASLRRLGTDCIDLYQFHLGRYEGDAGAVRDVLEELVESGKIRFYGWSTDDPERARFFAGGKHCCAIQQRLNLFDGNEETLRVCEQFGLASINRGPLAQGILTGKFTPDSDFPNTDLRHNWNFKEGVRRDMLERLDAVREILTADGRTLAQGAICWLWAKSEQTIPIPGFKTVAQVTENAGALRFGPLSAALMAEVERLMREK